MTDTHMPAPPAFCSLDREAYTMRLAQIMGLMLKFEGRVETAADGAVLRFKRGEGLKRALDELVEAEGRCCSSLVLTLTQSEAECALHVLMPKGSGGRVWGA